MHPFPTIHIPAFTPGTHPLLPIGVTGNPQVDDDDPVDEAADLDDEEEPDADPNDVTPSTPQNTEALVHDIVRTLQARISVLERLNTQGVY